MEESFFSFADLRDALEILNNTDFIVNIHDTDSKGIGSGNLNKEEFLFSIT